MAEGKIGKFKEHKGGKGEEHLKKKPEKLDRKKERKAAEAAARSLEQADTEAKGAKERGARGREAVKSKPKSTSAHVKKADAVVVAAEKQIDQKADELHKKVAEVAGGDADGMMEEIADLMLENMGDDHSSAEEIENIYIESIKKAAQTRKKLIPAEAVEMQIKRDLHDKVSSLDTKNYKLSAEIMAAIRDANEMIKSKGKPEGNAKKSVEKKTGSEYVNDLASYKEALLKVADMENVVEIHRLQSEYKGKHPRDNKGKANDRYCDSVDKMAEARIKELLDAEKKAELAGMKIKVKGEDGAVSTVEVPPGQSMGEFLDKGGADESYYPLGLKLRVQFDPVKSTGEMVDWEVDEISADRKKIVIKRLVEGNVAYVTMDKKALDELLDSYGQETADRLPEGKPVVDADAIGAGVFFESGVTEDMAKKEPAFAPDRGEVIAQAEAEEEKTFDLSTPEGRQAAIDYQENNIELSDEQALHGELLHQEAGKEEKAESKMLEIIEGDFHVVEDEIKNASEKEKAEIGTGLEVARVVSEAEKDSFFAGLYSDIKDTRFGNVGFVAQKVKNNIFSKLFGGLMGKFSSGDKNIQDQGTMARFMASLSESYSKEAKAAEKSIQEIKDGDSKKFHNARHLMSNVFMYGRTAADIMGKTAASPFRYVMMGAMGLARSTEAMKEARLKNAEVLSKTAIHDIAEAEKIAWELYEQSKGKGEVTSASLQQAYEMNLPKDVLERLSHRVDAAEANTMMQKIISFDVRQSVERINNAIIKIENNGKSAAEQEAEKEKIIKKYSKHLNDLDRMVARWGTVDTLAIGAKYATTAGKAVIAGLTVESLYMLTQNLPKIFDSLHNVFSDEHKAPAGTSDGLVSKMTGKSHMVSERTGTGEVASRATATVDAAASHQTGTADVKSGLTGTAEAVKSMPTATGIGRTAESLAGKAPLTAETFKIGSRGPEGTIIDHLKAQGISRQEAGVKAHKMFVEWMHSAEGKKFLGEKLPNMEINDKNYLEAMKHIKDGAIEITPEGKMKIVDAKLLKFIVDHEPGVKLETREFGAGIKETQGSVDYGKKIESLTAELAKAKKELEGDVESFLHDEYPRGIGNGVSAEEYLKDHPDADGITHKFVRDDVLRMQELERQIAESKMHLAGAEDVTAGKGKVAQDHIADKQPGMKEGGKLQPMAEALANDARQAKFAQVLKDPSDKKALLGFIGKPDKYLYNDVSAAMGKDGDMRIEFSVKNDPVDVELIITKDGKIAVDGHGFNNWPDTMMKPVPMTKENLDEALDFINSRGKFSETGGAVSITEDAERRRVFEDLDVNGNGNGNGHEASKIIIDQEAPKKTPEEIPGQKAAAIQKDLDKVTEAKAKIDLDAKGTGTIEQHAVLKGTTGKEFLKDDYMKHLKPGKAGVQMEMLNASIASRDVTSNLAQYKSLIDNNDPKAEEFAKALEKRASMWAGQLGKEVVDMEKIKETLEMIKNKKLN